MTAGFEWASHKALIAARMGLTPGELEIAWRLSVNGRAKNPRSKPPLLASENDFHIMLQAYIEEWKKEKVKVTKAEKKVSEGKLDAADLPNMPIISLMIQDVRDPKQSKSAVCICVLIRTYVDPDNRIQIRLLLGSRIPQKVLAKPASHF